MVVNLALEMRFKLSILFLLLGVSLRVFAGDAVQTFSTQNIFSNQLTTKSTQKTSVSISDKTSYLLAHSHQFSQNLNFTNTEDCQEESDFAKKKITLHFLISYYYKSILGFSIELFKSSSIEDAFSFFSKSHRKRFLSFCVLRL